MLWGQAAAGSRQGHAATLCAPVALFTLTRLCARSCTRLHRWRRTHRPGRYSARQATGGAVRPSREGTHTLSVSAGVA